MFIELDRLICEILHTQYFFTEDPTVSIMRRKMRMIEDNVEELIHTVRIVTRSAPSDVVVV